MSTHTAQVTWSRNDGSFADGRYSRVHAWTFDGGARVEASASPQVVRVPMSDPTAVDPEEAFVAALSSCHMLWFLSLAARAGLIVETYQDQAEGRLDHVQGRMRMAEVRLRPHVRLAAWDDSSGEVVAQLHYAAHEACYLANSVTCPIRVEPRT